MRFRSTAILGASTLAGRELAERLRGTASPAGALTLVDPGADHATIAAIGGQLAVSTPRLAEAAAAADLVLCCAPLSGEDADLVRDAAGSAVVVDLAGSLGGEPFDAVTGRPVLEPGRVHASPSGAGLLASALTRSARAAGASRASLVVLEAASELGSEAIDELHRQALAVLSFQPVPQAVLGGQLVHDLASPGPQGESREGRIRMEVAALTGSPSPPLMLVRAGVFHGVAIAAWSDAAPGPWTAAIAAEPRLSVEATGSVSPVASVQREAALVGRVAADPAGGSWAWAAADTLVHGATGNLLAWLGAAAPGVPPSRPRGRRRSDA